MNTIFGPESGAPPVVKQRKQVYKKIYLGYGATGEAVWAKWRSASIVIGISVAQLVRNAVDEYVDGKKPNKSDAKKP